MFLFEDSQRGAMNREMIALKDYWMLPAPRTPSSLGPMRVPYANEA